MSRASSAKLVRQGKVKPIDVTHEDVANEVWAFMCQDMMEVVVRAVAGFDGELVAKQLLLSVGHTSEAWDKYKAEVALRLRVGTTPEEPVI